MFYTIEHLKGQKIIEEDYGLMLNSEIICVGFDLAETITNFFDSLIKVETEELVFPLDESFENNDDNSEPMEIENFLALENLNAHDHVPAEEYSSGNIK